MVDRYTLSFGPVIGFDRMAHHSICGAENAFMSKLREPTNEEISVLKLNPDELIAWHGCSISEARNLQYRQSVDKCCIFVIVVLFLLVLFSKSHNVTYLVVSVCLSFVVHWATVKYPLTNWVGYAITNQRIISCYVDEGTPLVYAFALKDIARTRIIPWRDNRNIGTLVFERACGVRRKISFLVIDRPSEVDSLFKEILRGT